LGKGFAGLHVSHSGLHDEKDIGGVVDACHFNKIVYKKNVAQRADV
jgi:hypothetical protein